MSYEPDKKTLEHAASSLHLAAEGLKGDDEPLLLIRGVQLAARLLLHMAGYKEGAKDENDRSGE